MVKGYHSRTIQTLWHVHSVWGQGAWSKWALGKGQRQQVLSTPENQCLPCPTRHQKNRDTIQRIGCMSHCGSYISLQCLMSTFFQIFEAKGCRDRVLSGKGESTHCFRTVESRLVQSRFTAQYLWLWKETFRLLILWAKTVLEIMKLSTVPGTHSSEWVSGPWERTFLLPGSFPFWEIF